MTLFCILFPATLIFAVTAPLPPEIAINHSTHQCAFVMRGDECVICTLPEDWEIIGRESESQCPLGYEEISLQLECKGVRELRCCLPGHSGGQGDCAGLALEIFLIITFGLLLVTAIAGLTIWLRHHNHKNNQQV